MVRSWFLLNVRCLMYQSLICGAILCDSASGLASPLDAERCKSLANALIYGVRRDVELGGNFLRIEVLVYQSEAGQLPFCEPRYTSSHRVGRANVDGLTRLATCSVHFFQRECHPAQR